MDYLKRKQYQRDRRTRRVRAKLFGTADRPRLSVTRSNQHIYLQAINDEQAQTIVSASDLKIKKGTKTERAQQVAKAIAQQLQKNNIDAVVFDRGSYKYHGRVKAVAEVLREEGIKV